MKILSVGAAGKMGKAVVAYLSKDPEVKQVGLADMHEKSLTALAQADKSGKCKPHLMNIENTDEVKKIIGEYDAVVVTLPNRKASYKMMEAAIDAKVNLVDILEEYHRRPDLYETEGLTVPPGMKNLHEYGEALHEKAVKNNVLILDGMGFAPGLSNVTTGHGVSQLDQCDVAIARVGGIPSLECRDQHPLRYMTTWSIEHVLREYNVKTQIIRDGNITETPALADMENFQFTRFGYDEPLECAVTPGMPSFIYTNPNLQYFAEKTVRWPGHFQGVKTLLECGMLSETPIEYEGVNISPRKFFLHIVNPLLAPKSGHNDTCIMYNTVTGKKNGKDCKYEYFMWENGKDGFSGMQRVTSFPAAIGTKMVAAGKIKLTGIRAPEECITGDLYTSMLADLKKVDITIEENSVLCI